MRSSDLRPYRGEIWRLVESQNRTSTMRITDNLDDQALLEEMIDEAKPRVPPDCAGLHFLLATPFRHTPYPNPSRFRRAQQYPGVFYGAESQMTAVAELAFYRMLFFLEAPGMKRPARPVEHRAFSAACATGRSVDLTAPPFDARQAEWTHPTDYAPCHALADEARGAGAELIRYQSVRDPDGFCAAVLTPKAFAQREPVQMETWNFFVRAAKVQVWREFPPLQREYAFAEFDRDPRVRRLLERQGPAEGRKGR